MTHSCSRCKAKGSPHYGRRCSDEWPVTYISEIMAQPQEFGFLGRYNIFFIGIASCAVLYACYLHWRNKPENSRLEMIAVFIAITMGTALLALTADLHQTARVWHLRSSNNMVLDGALYYYHYLPHLLVYILSH